MNRLVWSLKQLTDADRNGSIQTRANRWTLLKQMAATLDAGGFRKLHAKGIKPKHVEHLINTWLNEASPRTGSTLSPGTIKNRTGVLRWWAKAVGKANIVPASNDSLGVPQRTYSSGQDRSQTLTPEHLAKINCPYVYASIQLQAAFGLRREEALKFQPSLADKSDHIHLLGSWCKGGRPRSVPILTGSQREALDHALRLAPTGSLIPKNKRYVDQLVVWVAETRRIGLPRTHGLRHEYAHGRYRTLTDREPPILGGCPSAALKTAQERAQDRHARLQIAEELGHSRINITNTYLGS